MKKTILEHIRDVTGEMEESLLFSEDFKLEARIDRLAYEYLHLAFASMPRYRGRVSL